MPSPQSSDETTSHSTKHDEAVQVAGYPASGESEARGAEPGEREKQSLIPELFQVAPPVKKRARIGLAPRSNVRMPDNPAKTIGALQTPGQF